MHLSIPRGSSSTCILKKNQGVVRRSALLLRCVSLRQNGQSSSAQSSGRSADRGVRGCGLQSSGRTGAPPFHRQSLSICATHNHSSVWQGHSPFCEADVVKANLSAGAFYVFFHQRSLVIGGRGFGEKKKCSR